MVILNLVAISLLFPSIYTFGKVAIYLRPEYSEISLISGKFSLANILIILGVSFVVIFVHELIHGVFFWIYTRDRPIFAYKILYAFAAAPEWFIPKTNFIVIGLSPAILITVLALFLIMITPSSMVKIVSLAGAINFAGSTGDFAVVIWTLTLPKSCLVKDSGDSFDIYQPYVEKMQFPLTK